MELALAASLTDLELRLAGMSVATGSHTRWLLERDWAPPPPPRPVRLVGGVVEELDDVEAELELELEPEPELEFSLAPGDQARVTARTGVIFRSGPEMDSEQLGILEHGEVIDVREVRPLDESQLQPGQRQRVRFGRCVRVPGGVEEIIGWTSAGQGRNGPLLAKVFRVTLDKTETTIEPGMNRYTPAWFWSAPEKRVPAPAGSPDSSSVSSPTSSDSVSPQLAMVVAPDSLESPGNALTVQGDAAATPAPNYPMDESVCDESAASSCGSSSRGSPSSKLKLVVDHEYEAYRAQTGEPVTAPAPDWYTCMYCMTKGEHFRGACPRMRPTTRERPVRPAFDEGHGMGVDWIWDQDDVIALPRQPGLLGRLQAEHRALVEAAEKPRANDRAVNDAYRAAALAVYKAVPTWGPDAKLLRAACGKVQQTAEALHMAENALLAMTDRQRKKIGEAQQAKVARLRADLAAARGSADALNKSGDFFRRVEALRSEPGYRERLDADPPAPPGVAASAWAAAHEQRASMPSRLRSLLTPQERTRLAYLKQWNRLRRGRRAARRAAIGSVKAVGSAFKVTFRIGRHFMRSTHSWVKRTSRTMRKEVDDVADIMGWWKPKLTPPPTPDEFTNVDRQTLHGMGFTDDQENEQIMRECGGDFDAAVSRLEKEREAKGEAVAVIKSEHNRARQDEMEVRSGWLDDMGLQLSQYGSMKGVGWAGEIRYMGVDSEMVYDYGSRRGATPDVPNGSRFARSAYEQQMTQRHKALVDASSVSTTQAGSRDAWSASEE
eukprot:COSAG02_NODE_273_length_26316_cov_13.661060_7_plen_778_part_00